MGSTSRCGSADYLHITGFAETLLAQGEPLAESLTLEPGAEGELQLPTLATAIGTSPDMPASSRMSPAGRAFACLVDARRIGLRLRLLNKAMCPRFHVDHVPLRLITTYAGAAANGCLRGHGPSASRRAISRAHRCGRCRAAAGRRVALFKGEMAGATRGAGIIHRSPLPHRMRPA